MGNWYYFIYDDNIWKSFFERLKRKEIFKSDEELMFLGVDIDILRFMRRCLNEIKEFSYHNDDNIIYQHNLIEVFLMNFLFLP